MIRSKGRTEAQVQAGVLAYLSTRQDFLFWRSNTGVMRTPDGRTVRFGLKGAADIQGVLAPTGRMVGIEVKRETGGLVSPEQARWGLNLERHGGKYIVASDVETVERELGPPTTHVLKLVPPRVIHR